MEEENSQQNIPSSQPFEQEQDSQELDYPLTQKPPEPEQDSQELLESDEEDSQKLKIRQDSINRVVSLLNRGLHKRCIAAFQYTLDYASIDVQDVIKFVEDIENKKTTLRKSSMPYEEEHTVELYEVLGFLQWIKQKTD